MKIWRYILLLIIFNTTISDSNNIEKIDNLFTMVKDNNYNTRLIQQPLNSLKLIYYKNAKIRILNYNSGDTKIINISNEYVLFGNIKIKVLSCIKEESNFANKIHMALIVITYNDIEKYKGWVFKNMTSLSLPRIYSYFFYLIDCE